MINKINIIFNFFLNQIESSIRNQSTKQAANNLKISKSFSLEYVDRDKCR